MVMEVDGGLEGLAIVCLLLRKYIYIYFGREKG